MNYMVFEGEGVYSKTGRKRKITIEAFSEREAIEELQSSGYIAETINIDRVPFPSPTEEQIRAMKKHKNRIPPNACMKDISFLIDKYMCDQREPERTLIDFATSQKVKLSYYTGEESLYNCIWYKFSLEEKFAFYLLCVEKDLKGKWQFEKFDYYKSLSYKYLNDNKFMNSFKRYSSSGKNFYGFIKEQGVEYGHSASRNTNCYKIAVSIVS
ncbi:MAG: hypothetical protein HFG80_09810 [Eubacterium sp.]|nr:hypothetical protein [Eubacterium sp.]